MNIQPQDISSIEEIGDLDGEAISLIRTTGGLHIAVGKKVGVLSSGSHPAIVKYQLEKSHKSYSPRLAKSEAEDDRVTGLSTYIAPSLYNAGYDLYALEKSDGSDKELIFAKSGMELVTYKIGAGENSLVVKSVRATSEEALRLASQPVAEAMATDALSQGLKFVEKDGIRFDAEDIVK